MIKAILFDLDGTLLPLDQDWFIKVYFDKFAEKFKAYGFEPEKMISSIYAGVRAMTKNDGTKSNEEVFWSEFANQLGDEILNYQDKFEEFYQNEFETIKEICGFDKRANETVKLLKGQGYKVILATNPFYPYYATESRMRWAGLEITDFDLYTTYENESFSKPNLEYYKSIAERFGLKPEECLMVGNDVDEDMVAEKIGMKVFLFDECLLNRKNSDISAYPKGSYDELLKFIKNL